MNLLIDSDVMIDCLRSYPAAIGWLATADQSSVVVPGVVAMELVSGCRNASELSSVENFLAAFTIEWPSQQDFKVAFQLLKVHKLASGIDIGDCLIAALALRLGSRLLTFNTRHFKAVPNLDFAAPYART